MSGEAEPTAIGRIEPFIVTLGNGPGWRPTYANLAPYPPSMIKTAMYLTAANLNGTRPSPARVFILETDNARHARR